VSTCTVCGCDDAGTPHSRDADCIAALKQDRDDWQATAEAAQDADSNVALYAGARERAEAAEQRVRTAIGILDAIQNVAALHPSYGGSGLRTLIRDIADLARRGRGDVLAAQSQEGEA
jgi:hypothetical protein